MKLTSRLNLTILIIVHLFVPTIQAQTTSHSNPLLVLLLMVKNEADFMEKTLQPFLDAKIDHYLIFDTGSTDDTVAVTREIFTRYGVQHGYIVEEPFIDFAISRNHAIQAAEALFPTAEFFFMIDSEWYLQNIEGLLEFCKQNRNTPETSYLMLLGNSSFENYMCRLFKPHHGIRFEGAVHEYLVNTFAFKRVPSNVSIYWSPSRYGVEKSKKRWERDRDILLKEHEREPYNARTVFYLAQTYDCLEDFENARIWYKKRASMLGWDEETFIALYRLGDSYNNDDDWPQALIYYLQAYNLRPNRAEPLVRIARHYQYTNEFRLCFFFAKAAADISFPNDETLFIDTVIYEYDRYDVLGIAAWYVGEYEIGEKAVRQALKRWPDANHLNLNLSLYLGRK